MKTLLGLGLMATLSLGASAQSCGPNNNAYNGQYYNNGQYRSGYTQPYTNTYGYNNYNYRQPYNSGYYNNSGYNNGYYNNGYYQPYRNNVGANIAGGLLNAVLNQVIR